MAGKAEKGKAVDYSTLHWSFSAARKTMSEHDEQKLYTCASGITPSGVVHIGNFRESITVDLVKRAFKKLGKNARHIHSWDDNDVFRKVPKNMPKQGMLKQNLRKCIVDVPDPYGKAESYAQKHIKDVEESLPAVGINPEYLYQSQKYRSCEYAEQIRHAIENTRKIKDILDRYRKEPLPDDWLPVLIFCPSCQKDTIKKVEYKGDHNLYYECECGHKEEFDFRKKGIVKLLWRVDWPMRWAYEDVHFEPGGKDHSSPGGSFDTGKQIVELLWKRKAPAYIMYDFITIKGMGGKISSSAGEVVTLKDCLEIYEPEIIRWLFAGTRPKTEFAISFDMDVIKIYEDYDRCERVYYGKEEASEKEKQKQKMIYELSQVEEDLAKIPKEMPLQISFRHIINIIQVKGMGEKETLEFFRNDIKNRNDEKRLLARVRCVKNWVGKYADEQFKFSVKEEKDASFFSSLDENSKKALSLLKEAVEKNKDEESLTKEVYDIPKKADVPVQEFFKLCYRAIISKEKGPKLVPFMVEIGLERVAKLLDF